METLEIQTLGTAEVRLGGSPVHWHSDSARALFFYLLARPEGQSRERLIEDLWHSDPDDHASNRFRVTVHRVRHALGRPDAVAEAYGRYRLSPEVAWSSDLRRFFDLLERADRAADPEARLRLYLEAVGLYRGDFLPGEGGDWAAETRLQAREAYARAGIAAARLLCEQGECRAALAAQGKALTADPYLGENHHQDYLRRLWRQEGKYRALEYYRRFLRFLRDELGDTPTPETVALAERIKHSGEAGPSADEGSDPPLTELAVFR